MLDAVGIKVNARPMTSQAMTDQDTSGEWDLRISTSGRYLLPFTRCNDLAPITPQTPDWNREGSESHVCCVIGKRRWSIWSPCTVRNRIPTRVKSCSTSTTTSSRCTTTTIGTIIGRKGLALAERFKNVPGGTPPRCISGSRVPSCRSQSGRRKTSTRNRYARIPSRCTTAAIGR